MNESSLIYVPKIVPASICRLLCFSYAGGNASTYLPWKNNLDSAAELAVVQLPGRGGRIAETSYESMQDIVKDLFVSLLSLNDKPLIFFGHSMGAKVAYELTLMLARYGYKVPIHFIASGCSSPFAAKCATPIFDLPDEEFIRRLCEMNGSHKDILNNWEFMRLMLPALRADFKISETYQNMNKPIVQSVLSIFAGTNDNIELANIDGWCSLFGDNTGIKWFNGDHFFINSQQSAVLSAVNNIIQNAKELIKLK